MEIDPLDNDLDYPAKEEKESERCPKCGKYLKTDDWGAYCSCGYKEQLSGEGYD